MSQDSCGCLRYSSVQMRPKAYVYRVPPGFWVAQWGTKLAHCQTWETAFGAVCGWLVNDAQRRRND